jgi:hypothetical protein
LSRIDTTLFVANAVAGALVTAYKEPGVSNFYRKLEYKAIGIV